MGILPFDVFLKQIKMNTWVLGIPYGDPKVYLRFYLIFIQLILMLGCEIAFFVSRVSPENFIELTYLFPCLSSGLLTASKTMLLILKRKKIYELTENLRELYQNIYHNAEKSNLVTHNLVLVNTFGKYFFRLNILVVSLYNFSTLVLMAYLYFKNNEIKYLLPFAVLLPFSTDSWVPWLLMYIYSITCAYACVFLFTSVDIFYFNLTSHVCAHYSVIGDRITKLNATNVDQLPNIVRDHQYIHLLGKKLENIFTVINLFNMMSGSLQLCALGFNITVGTWQQLPSCVIFLISTMLQMLMISVFGENLLTESGKLSYAAFLCKWYEMDEKSKKTILTIMIRTMKPQELTAYKFSTVSYASFSKIISTSWSYFTILRTVYTPPDEQN